MVMVARKPTSNFEHPYRTLKANRVFCRAAHPWPHFRTGSGPPPPSAQNSLFFSTCIALFNSHGVQDEIDLVFEPKIPPNPSPKEVQNGSVMASAIQTQNSCFSR